VYVEGAAWREILGVGACAAAVAVYVVGNTVTEWLGVAADVAVHVPQLSAIAAAVSRVAVAVAVHDQTSLMVAVTNGMAAANADHVPQLSVIVAGCVSGCAVAVAVQVPQYVVTVAGLSRKTMGA
jgi:hypothetical protein